MLSRGIRTAPIRAARSSAYSLERRRGWQFRYLPDRTELTDQMGQTEWYIFNADRVLVEHIDAAGNITKHDVDGRGNTVKLTDACARAQLMTYDMRVNVTSVTDAAGHPPRDHIPPEVVDAYARHGRNGRCYMHRIRLPGSDDGDKEPAGSLHRARTRRARTSGADH